MSEKSLAEKATKLRLDLLPPEPIAGAAKCLQFGANKHGERKWETEPMKFGMVLAALKRHLLKFEMGEDRDYEMEVLHMDAVVTNAMILSTYLHRGIGVDNLPSRNQPKAGPPRCSECGALIKFQESIALGKCWDCRSMQLERISCRDAE